jgi:hypothetical protein
MVNGMKCAEAARTHQLLLHIPVNLPHRSSPRFNRVDLDPSGL